MIKVTRLNNVPLILNSDLIEHIDVTPDTVITLVSGQKYIVQEPADEVVERIVTFRQSLLRGQRAELAVISGGKLAAKPALREQSANG